MIEIGAESARKKLPELLDKAKAGEQAIITKHGKPYAAIVPVEQRIDVTIGGVLSLFGTGKGLWGDTPGRYINSLREEWGG
ncbi:MAG: type II toxin-antitoxin system prevent-host-death family antitoxin [Candidatus Marinimicrobia bacterium]|nr:type II toxin-antitoxin system prevent-host-death family antitoxin [Candidatus Neomarinimicrobiota bacterium]MCH7764132.1 type II toxin-antitoxin system prevent-host-death family antitoxin [Candidatus Neomarinimicrobiota bacterium]